MPGHRYVPFAHLDLYPLQLAQCPEIVLNVLHHLSSPGL